MKKIILVGRTGCGKTTLTQALKGEPILYHKTQYVNHFDVVIDTPGEYVEDHHLGRALALYVYEADVVALLLNACEPYSLYAPLLHRRLQPAGDWHCDPDPSARRQSGTGRAVAAACRMPDHLPHRQRYRRRRVADFGVSAGTGRRFAVG